MSDVGLFFRPPSRIDACPFLARFFLGACSGPVTRHGQTLLMTKLAEPGINSGAWQDKTVEPLNLLERTCQHKTSFHIHRRFAVRGTLFTLQRGVLGIKISSLLHSSDANGRSFRC